MLKLTAMGNLGKDAILNNVNGKNVIRFSVAHSDKYKDQQGNQIERTIWVDCSYWTDRNLAPYLTRGSKVLVEGTPSVETYKNKDNIDVAVLRLRVTDLHFAGSAPNAQGNQATEPSHQTQAAPANTQSEPADDLPF